MYENVSIRTQFRPNIQKGTVEVSRELQPKMLTVERKKGTYAPNMLTVGQKKARGRDEETQHVIVCQKHKEKCTQTYQFEHISGQSYRGVQSMHVEHAFLSENK